MEDKPIKIIFPFPSLSVLPLLSVIHHGPKRRLGDEEEENKVLSVAFIAP